MAVYNHIVLPRDFNFLEAAGYFFAALKGGLASHDELRLHFVDRHSAKHESWRAVPRKSRDELADDVLVLIGGAADDLVCGANAVEPKYKKLSERLRTESALDARPAPDAKTIHPTVRARLPEFVLGTLLGEITDQARAGLLRDVTTLLWNAADLLARDESADVLEMGRLIKTYASRLPTKKAAHEEQRRLDIMTLRACMAIELARRDNREAEADAARAKVSRRNILALGALPDGEGAFVLRRDVLVVWGESNEDGFVRAVRAMHRDAGLVVQLTKRGGRVLVVLDEGLAPEVRGKRAGGLAHVAAILRNADAMVRHRGEDGYRLRATRLVSERGLQAPPGSEPVFTMSHTGNAVGNLDPSLPRSVLSGEAIAECILAVLDPENELLHGIKTRGGKFCLSDLSAACIPR
jgi:hypothetical protein